MESTKHACAHTQTQIICTQHLSPSNMTKKDTEKARGKSSTRVEHSSASYNSNSGHGSPPGLHTQLPETWWDWMPHPQFKRTKPKTKPKHPQDAKVYQTGLFIVPKHKRSLFSFLSLFIKTLAITAPWISEVFYLSLFSVLSSCNKIYLSGISCSASRLFFPAIAGIMYPSRLQQ